MNVTNLIRPDGSVLNLHVENGEKFLVRNSAIAVTVKTAASMTDHAIVEFRLEDGWTSPVTFEAGVTPSLDGVLSLRLAPGAVAEDLVGHTFRLFTRNAPLAGDNRFASVYQDPGATFDLSDHYTTGEVTFRGASSESATPIPEPAALALLAPGALLMLRRRTRRG
jgi:hypothetical protein